jgi:hypothetical protein
MRNHPSDGTEILQAPPSLRRYIPVVRAHHEWYDGTGYPDGKKGHEIPFHAQIIALADAFDAMTTDRPYRQALGAEEALEETSGSMGRNSPPTSPTPSRKWCGSSPRWTKPPRGACALGHGSSPPVLLLSALAAAAVPRLRLPEGPRPRRNPGGGPRRSPPLPAAPVPAPAT